MAQKRKKRITLTPQTRKMYERREELQKELAHWRHLLLDVLRAGDEGGHIDESCVAEIENKIRTVQNELDSLTP